MALKEEMEQQGNWLFKYRGTLPLIILLVGLSVFVFDNLHSKSEGKGMLYGDAYKIACMAVCLLGLAIRMVTIGFAPRNTSGRNTTGQLADVLNCKAIYATVRHPLYLGNFFMWLGICMLTFNFWFIVAFCFMYWVYYERIMFAEEQFLSRKFGQNYTNWAANTPAFLPRPSQWKTTDQYFNWKKIIRQEKNGVTAIFILLFLFDFTGYYIHTGSFTLEVNFWLLACIGSGLLYLFIKMLRDKTNLLLENAPPSQKFAEREPLSV